MTSGEPSPWAPRPGEHPGSYAGPWSAPPVPGPSVPWGTVPPWPPAAADHPSDEQLRRLPPPAVALAPGRPAAPSAQRPAVVGLAVTLAVTGSLLWVCELSLVLLVALAATRQLSPLGQEGYVFHTLDELVLRMGDGLWVPLYGFPVASLVTGFLLLAGRPWTRVAHTVVGVAALGWAGWWLRDSLLPWFVVAVYVGTAVAVLWVPSVGRWYATRARPPRGGTVPLSG